MSSNLRLVGWVLTCTCSLLKFAWKLDRNAKLREKKSPAIKETRLVLEKLNNGSLNTLINELKVGLHWGLHGISSDRLRTLENGDKSCQNHSCSTLRTREESQFISESWSVPGQSSDRPFQ